MIPALADAAPHAPKMPGKWPPERFDVVWVLERQRGRWAFVQLPQRLLAGDRRDPHPMRMSIGRLRQVPGGLFD
jgi:hypothetical protein